MLNKNTQYSISTIIEEEGLPVYISRPQYDSNFFVKLTKVNNGIAFGDAFRGTQQIDRQYHYPLHYIAYYCDWDDLVAQDGTAEETEWIGPYTLPPRVDARFHDYYDLTLPPYIPGKTILQVKRNGEWVNAIFTGYELRNEKVLVYTYHAEEEKFCSLNGSLIGDEIPLERAGYKELDMIKYLSTRSTSKNVIYDFLANERHVEYLVHFTPVDNLKSILENGIAPRVYFDDGVDFISTDRERLDRHPECSCFSLSFPNYQMFSAKRSDTRLRFAVLRIDIKALLSSNVDKIFMLPVNAAYNEVRWHISDYDQLQDARNMFAKELVYKGISHRRSALGIPDEYPTSPQAEIMIDGIVPAKYIREIHFDSDVSLVNAQSMKDLLPYGTKMMYSNELFKRRLDCAHW
ncbi:MAG: DUF4433 domain-containing protein [Oscillospiraceae bacterium]|nr:DUF4433 domain-containing protein [Oscillospiraceae bacterium]